MQMQSEPPQESGGALNVEWNTDDEQEVFGTKEFPATIYCKGEASSSSSNPLSALLDMGFNEDQISRAIKEHGNGADVTVFALLERLLNYSESSNELQIPSEELLAPSRSADQQTCDNYNLSSDNDLSSSDYDESIIYHLSDTDSESDENSNYSSVRDRRGPSLLKMGYTADEVSIALDICGHGASILVLIDFLSAHQLAKEQDLYLHDAVKVKSKKRKLSKKKRAGLVPDDDCLHLPNPMVGFGLPYGPRTTHRELPKEALGPPYFYYENVALTPKGVWQIISQNLYGIEPEFVDSKYFCVAARKRGYVHNLPINNRSPLFPVPPMTISDAFPLLRKWWPTWDNREKLNCLLTVYCASKSPERIRKALEEFEGEPPRNLQKYVMSECRRWNLVWVGKNKVAPLDPDEVESVLGFPMYHTRGGGPCTQERYQLLGNSFQVDTVGYHLSALKQVRPLHPEGMNVLSLFSGIGGAEVALHRLGIQFKTVVSAEKREASRAILRSWWEENNVKGTLIEFDDVQLLTSKKLEELIKEYGGFDLVIGGSPCTNLAGANRVSRHGLEGKDSALFFEYVRILKCVKDLMRQMQH